MDKIEREDLIKAGYVPKTEPRYFNHNMEKKEVETGDFIHPGYEPAPRISTYGNAYLGQIEALRWNLVTRADFESFLTKKVPTFCDLI